MQRALQELEYEFYLKSINGELPSNAPVDSVNGQTGIVVLDSSDLSNESTIVGATVTDAFDTLNITLSQGIDGVLFDIPADIQTSIPFSISPVTLGSFSPTESGDYRIILNLITSMSATNRSWQGELRLNGSPLAGVASPYISVEHKDSSDRVSMTFQRRLALTNTDTVEFVFGTESFGSTASVRAGSQLEILKVDV